MAARNDNPDHLAAVAEVAKERGCIGPFPCGRDIPEFGGSDAPCDCEDIAIGRDVLKYATREWRVIIRRPGVDGEGVSYISRGQDEEAIARRFFEADVREYAKSEPSASVVLQSRLLLPWDDVE